MNTKIILIVIALFSLTFRNERICAQTVTPDSIIQTSPCAGSNIYIPYTVNGGNFNFGNVFTAQLSNNIGSFNNPTNIGSLPYWSSGMIIGTIPLTTPLGIFYKVRIVSSSPADTSAPSPNNVIVTTVAQIATVVVNPNDTFCSGDSATLTVITPGQDYVWSTGETTQSIDVSQSGVYSVTVTDMLGCKTVSSPITITVQICGGVHTIRFDGNIIVYPNPATGKVTITAGEGSINTIEVYNMWGEKMYLEKILNSKPVVSGVEPSLILNLNLPDGVYFLLASSSSGKIYGQKIIIQK